MTLYFLHETEVALMMHYFLHEVMNGTNDTTFYETEVELMTPHLFFFKHKNRSGTSDTTFYMRYKNVTNDTIFYIQKWD